MFSKLAALTAVFAVLPMFALAQSGTGDATFFSPGLGACGVTNSNSDPIVAISSQIFNNGLCGRQMNVNFQGRSVTVTVVDSCPGCGSGDIDLSPSAFSQLADPSVGRIQGVQWNIV
ncbi:hypothetical protein D9758_005359 [Tetrapyrgos nigripes]|uniref:RlpA-like protein double-psi beta-barrel domain-containing protein n=1 Tax=Tetrapyrgos nigripes TaxID=182062 RepID=A0A8H5LPL1_9AGAR|nr:hypothetical protein D9758_005359 [Tetrapyrgos nigripes]